MVHFNSTFVLCILGLLHLASSRQPLVNNNGRFIFVDNVKTIGLDESTYTDQSTSTLARRAANGPLCRAKCGPRSGDTSRLRKKSQDIRLEREILASDIQGGHSLFLTKRLFDEIGDIDDYLYQRFETPPRNFKNVIYEPPDRRRRKGNSATFQLFDDPNLGDNPAFDMGLEGLCGCTTVFIVSQRAVWAAHIFEEISWSPEPKYVNYFRKEHGIRESDIFKKTALEFFNHGYDYWGERLFTGLAPKAEYFQGQEAGQVSAYIFTPQAEENPPGSSAVGSNSPPRYTSGLMYGSQVRRVALDGDSEDPDVHAEFDMRRGKALFQYDPHANEQGQRGWRLFLEGDIVDDDFWDSEERLLSGPESQNQLLHSCSGKLYQDFEYTCYNNTTLCPILDSVPTLLCGAQCYLQSLYNCYGEEKLCPILDWNPTLPCGDACYLRHEYSCNGSTLVLVSPNQNPSQSGSELSVTSTGTITRKPTSSESSASTTIPGIRATEVIFGGTTYTFGTRLTTIVQDEHTIVIGSGSLIIGTDTVSIPVVKTEPVVLTTDGITITFNPGASPTTHSSGPSGSFSSSDVITTATGAPVPGPTAEPDLPSSTASSSTLIPYTSTVLIITASNSLSTTKVTYTPTTFSQLSTLTSTTTITTDIGGMSTSVIIGPGGLAWSPIVTSASLPGFPPIPLPTIPPAPQGSNTLPPKTTASPTTNIFPSTLFPFPPLTSATITSDGPNGPVVTTITGTTDSSGSIAPITTMSTAAAISSAKSLASKLSRVSDDIESFSSTADSSKASSATAAIKSAQSDTSDFGFGLSISLPSLCFIFCDHVGSAGNILNTLRDVVAGIHDGTAGTGALLGPLLDISSIADELVDDADELADDADEAGGSNDSTIQPQPSITSAPCSTATSITNCEVYCGTGFISGGVPTTSCSSTTCTVDIACSGIPSTSTTYEPRYCDLEAPIGSGEIIHYTYDGYAYIPVSPTSTSVPDPDNNGGSITSTSVTTTTTPTTSTLPLSTPISTSSFPATSTPAPAPPPIVCSAFQPCDAGGCAGTVVNNKATCKGNFATCTCIPNANTPGFSCGTPQLCESNNCAGKFSNGKATCTNTPAGCKCFPSTKTPGFSCGSPQSCEANECYGSTDVKNISTCRKNLAGCICLPSKNTPGLSSGENLVLSDCGIGLGSNGGSTSREMIYYSGDIWRQDGAVISKPNMMVNVPWDGSYPWRSSGVSAKLPNGDTVKAIIAPAVKDPTWAGYATHAYNEVPLICYSFHKDRLYKLDDGKWCSSAYVCNHHGPPVFDTKPDPSPAPLPPPEESLITTITSDKNFVGIYAQHASSVFGHLNDRVGNGKDCKETPVRLNSRCEITFKCHTTGNAVALSDMKSFLINNLPQVPGFASYEEVTYDGICKKFDSRPGHEGQCLQYTEKIDNYLVVPRTLDIQVETSSSGRQPKPQASLGYEINCVNSVDCAVCKVERFIASSSGVLTGASPLSCDSLCHTGSPNCQLCSIMHQGAPPVTPWGGKVFSVDCGQSC